MAIEQGRQVSPHKDHIAHKKRRKLSSTALEPIVSCARRLSLASHFEQWRDSDECVAFSPTEPILAVAQRPLSVAADESEGSGSSAPTSSALSILLQPLHTTTSKLAPVVLRAPIAQPSSGAYRVHTLRFSPSGSSLVAVIRSRSTSEGTLRSGDHTPGIHGLVCIWSRARGTGGALNEGWSLSGSWPTGIKGGQLDSDLIAVHWLPPARPVIQVRGPTPEASVSAPPTTQLPGQAASSRTRPSKRFQTTAHQPSGPTLRQRGVNEPEALIVVGVNSMVHLIHRHVSIHEHVPTPNAAQAPFHVISAPISSPGVGAANHGQFFALDHDSEPAVVSRCHLHPVAGEPALLLAYITDGQNGQIGLTELVVQTSGDRPHLAVRPVDPICYQLTAGVDAELHTPTPKQVTLLQMCPLPSQPGTAHPRLAEVNLLVAFDEGSEHGDRSTTLVNWALKRRQDVQGKGSLCEAFATLESQKKTLDDLKGDADLEWHAEFQRQRRFPQLRLLQVLTPPATSPSAEIAPLWLRWLSHRESNADHRANEIWTQFRHDQVDVGEYRWYGSSRPTPYQYALSPNAALQSGQLAMTGELIVRPFNPSPDGPSKHISDVLAMELAQAVMNRRTCSDILLASVRVLRSRTHRTRVMGNLALGLGLDLPCVPRGQDLKQSFGKDTKLLSFLGHSNSEVLAQLCQIHLAMASAASTSPSRSGDKAQHSEQRNDRLCEEEITKTRSVLRLLRTRQALQSARRGSAGPGSSNGTWDVHSVPSLMPVVGALVDDIEDLYRHCLVQAAQEDPKSVVPLPPLLELLSARTPLPIGLELLCDGMRLSLDLLQWLTEELNSGEQHRSTVTREAEQLAQDVDSVKQIGKTLATVEGLLPPIQQLNSASVPNSGMSPPSHTVMSSALPPEATPLLSASSTLGLSHADPAHLLAHQSVPRSGQEAALMSGATLVPHLPGQNQTAGTPTSAYARHYSSSVSRTLRSLHDVLKEKMGDSCAVDLGEVLSRLEAWKAVSDQHTTAKLKADTAPPDALESTTTDKDGSKQSQHSSEDGQQSWTALLGLSSAAESVEASDTLQQDSDRANFCQHLLKDDDGEPLVDGDPGNAKDLASSARSRTVLKQGGLPLFLSPTDFVTSLSDIGATRHAQDPWTVGNRLGSTRDALKGSSVPSHISLETQSGSRKVRRNLLTGEATTADCIPYDLVTFATGAILSGRRPVSALTGDSTGHLLTGTTSAADGPVTDVEIRAKIQADEEALDIALDARTKGLRDRVRTTWSRQIGGGGPGRTIWRDFWWAE